MRTFLAMAMAASLFVAAGCSCATGDCNPCETPVVDDCNTCVAAPVMTYAAPAVTYAAPAVTYAAPVVMEAPAPLAVAPITCNPCAGL